MDVDSPLKRTLVQPPTEIDIMLKGSKEAESWAAGMVTGAGSTVKKLLDKFVPTFFGGEKITVRDVKKLHVPTSDPTLSYFTDVLVNGFCGVLGPYCQESGTVLMNSHMSAESLFGSGERHLEKDSLGRCKAYTKTKRLLGVEEVTSVVIPCNIAEGEGEGLPHWFLSVFSTLSKQWTSFDSVNIDRSEFVRSLHVPLMNQMGHSADTPFIYQPTIGPGQSDGSQCGEFTCMFAMALVLGKQLPALAQSPDPAAFATKARKFIAKTICTNNLTLVSAVSQE